MNGLVNARFKHHYERSRAADFGIQAGMLQAASSAKLLKSVESVGSVAFCFWGKD